MFSGDVRNMNEIVHFVCGDSNCTYVYPKRDMLKSISLPGMGNYFQCPKCNGIYFKLMIIGYEKK